MRYAVITFPKTGPTTADRWTLHLLLGTKSIDIASHMQAFHCSTKVSKLHSKAIIACHFIYLKAAERSIEFCCAVFVLQQQTSEYCAAAHVQNI